MVQLKHMCCYFLHNSFTEYNSNLACKIYLYMFQRFFFHIELILLLLHICFGGDLYLENMTSL